MKKLIFLVYFVCIWAGLFAQNIEFTAEAPGVVSLGEQFRMIFTVNAECTGFKAPDFKNFEILAGPFTSTSSSFQMINGKTSQSISNSYTLILEASKEGKFTIPAAQVTVNGKKVLSNAVTVEVVKGSVNQNNNSNSSNANVGSSSDLFVRVNLNKTSVYQGEAVLATIKVYTRMRLVGFEDMKFPSYSGCFAQDIQTPSQISLERETINGKVYESGLLKQTLLFPQKSGEIIIDPYELQCVVQAKVGQSKNIFGQFFDDYENVRKKVRSNPVKINVRSLPANKPADFNGAVGTDFKITATIDKQNIKTNEGITIKLSLTGSGNIKLIDAPKIDVPSTFEKYDPKVETDIRNTASGSVGTKNVEYFFIARSQGDFRISPITFSYFDLNTNQYKTISTQEFNIKVEKGTDSDANSNNMKSYKEEVETLGSDIRFINQKKFELQKVGDTFFGSIIFYLFYIFAFLIFAGIVIVLRQRIKQNSNIALMKNKRANKISRKRLKLAAKYLSENNNELFYEEILKALWGYFSDKLAIPVSQLSHENINETLQLKGIDNEIIESISKVIDICEFARYAPVSENSQMDNVFTDAEMIITKLEQKLR